jgi:hypothetical protein
MIDRGTAKDQLRMYRPRESPPGKYKFMRAVGCTVLVGEEGFSRNGMDGVNCVGGVTLELSLGSLLFSSSYSPLRIFVTLCGDEEDKSQKAQKKKKKGP